ncbi:MAG: hypothetical protein HY000_06830 [Planctomycetes bacterium]|nr:hypothetical protein [Planctomycetota bacterium]
MLPGFYRDDDVTDRIYGHCTATIATVVLAALSVLNVLNIGPATHMVDRRRLVDT